MSGRWVERAEELRGHAGSCSSARPPQRRRSSDSYIIAHVIAATVPQVGVQHCKVTEQGGSQPCVRIKRFTAAAQGGRHTQLARASLLVPKQCYDYSMREAAATYRPRQAAHALVVMRPACMADHCWESWRNRRRSAAVVGVTRQGGGSATKEGCARSCCMLTQRHVTFGVQPRWGLWGRLLRGMDEASAAAFACTAAAGSAAWQPRGRLEQVVLRSNSGTKTNGAARVCLKGSNTSAENMGREREKRKCA